MKKFLTLLLIIILASVMGAVYGIIHDQLTYTISPEYYTRFKFIQFGFIEPNEIEIKTIINPRILVSLVGILATWWVGLIIGIILGLVGLIHNTYKQMFKVTINAFFITIFVAFITGLFGLAYGKFYLSKVGVDWGLPENLQDSSAFICVGSMHNFSYLGGLIGLVAGIIFSVKHKLKNKEK